MNYRFSNYFMVVIQQQTIKRGYGQNIMMPQLPKDMLCRPLVMRVATEENRKNRALHSGTSSRRPSTKRDWWKSVQKRK
jgi:hypothetical protein